MLSFETYRWDKYKQLRIGDDKITDKRHFYRLKRKIHFLKEIMEMFKSSLFVN